MNPLQSYAKNHKTNPSAKKTFLILDKTMHIRTDFDDIHP
jgi:hypothetical protein